MPLQKITLLITVNFLIQLCVDLLSAGFIDRIGYRASVILAHICAAAGIGMLTFLPEICPTPFMGILISLIILPNMLPAKMQPMLHVLQLQFSVTQLITALIGGVYAIIILAVLRNTSLGEQA